MSTGLSAIAQIEFDAQCKAAYQSAGKLQKHVRVKSNVIGGTVEFRRSSRGVATPRVPQTDVVPMGTSYAKPQATMADWNAAEYTDQLDQMLTNVEERAVLVNNVANAVARRVDQIIIDALDAANASANIAAAATGLTFAKLLRAGALMDARAVPAGQRKLAISARGKEDLLSDTKFTSRDFVNSYYIETGRLPQILGFDIEVIDDRDEGGLSLVSTTRKNYAWDMQALGLGIAYEGGVKVDWIPDKTSWLVNQLFKGGAVAIDPLGIIEIDSVEA